MPIESAQATAASNAVSSWWGGLGLYAKIAFGVISSALLLTVIIVPIVVASGSTKDVATTKTLTLRVLNYTANDCGASTTAAPAYRQVFATNGSSNPSLPTWEGTLYVKMVNGVCVQTPTVYAGWPQVMGESMTAPAVPTGYTGSFYMHNDTATGNLHLLNGVCVVYYYNMNTAAAWWQGIDASWAVIRTDAAASVTAPCGGVS